MLSPSSLLIRGCDLVIALALYVDPLTVIKNCPAEHHLSTLDSMSRHKRDKERGRDVKESERERERERERVFSYFPPSFLL
jgi:hypothetical protein